MTIAVIFQLVLLVANYMVLIRVVKSQRLSPSSCGACGERVSSAGALQCDSCDSDLLKVGVSSGVIMREPPRGMMIALAIVIILSLVQVPLLWAYSQVDRANAAGLGTAYVRTMVVRRESANPVAFQLDMIDHVPNPGETNLLPRKWIDLRQLDGPGSFPEPLRVEMVRDGAVITEVDQLDPMSVSMLEDWFSKTGDFQKGELTVVSEGLNQNIRRNIGRDPSSGFGVQAVGFEWTESSQSQDIIPVGWRVWGVFWGASAGIILFLLFVGVFLVSWLAREGDSS